MPYPRCRYSSLKKLLSGQELSPAFAMIMFVCPSVRLSVTLMSVSHAKTIQDIETLFAPTTEFSPNFT